MALFLQLRRTSFSLMVYRSISFPLSLVRPSAMQKLQVRVLSTVDSEEKGYSMSETGDDVHRTRQEPRALENIRRLHVGNLLVGKDKYTTKDTLLKYFSKYGEVESLEFFRREVSNLPRGFAFVTFRHVESAARALGEDAGSHIIDGQNIRISVPFKTGNKSLTGKANLTVVVNNISKETSKRAIEDHFSQFGQVERVIWAQKDPRDGNLSSYYVIFSSLLGAKKALQLQTQRISTQGIDSQVSEFTQTKNFTGKTERVVLKPLPDHITVEDLRDYFQQFGDVKLVELKLNYYDVPYPESNLNIAFVHFYDAAIVDEIIKTEDHIITGSRVTVLRHRNVQIITTRSRNWWVSMEGLPTSTKRSDVKTFFLHTFGITPVNIFVKRRSGKVLGIISFSRQEQVDLVLRKPTVTFLGVPVYFRKMFWSKNLTN